MKKKNMIYIYIYIGKIRKIYTSSFRSKVFTPQLLMHCCTFWSYTDCLNLCIIAAYDPQCENMDLKSIQSWLERVQICKRCWKTKAFVGPEGYFLMISRPFNCSG